MNLNEFKLFIANWQVLKAYIKSCQFHEAHVDFMLVLFLDTQKRNIDFGG